MAARTGRCAVCAGIWVIVALTTHAGAAEPTPATINQWIQEVAKRPPPSQVVLDTYARTQTINRPFPREFKEAIREVLEMRVSHMVLALAEGLKPEPAMDASPEEVRRGWRVWILQDARASSSTQFRDEVASVLGPILTAVALGYNDAAGQPDKAVRINAVLLLVQLPGSHESKVSALLRLLRTKGVDEGTLFMVIRELGEQKIAAAVPTLVTVLESPNPVLQATAARALGSIGDESALDSLLDLLNRAGDSLAHSPEVAREAVLAGMDGIRQVMAANSFDDDGLTEAKVVAALMRRVLTDPDRRVVVAAAEGIREVAKYPDRLDVRMSEDQLQGGVEALRLWWLRQRRAKEYYREFFRLEPMVE